MQRVGVDSMDSLSELFLKVWEHLVATNVEQVKWSSLFLTFGPESR